jgi:hypothetical protein
MACLDLVCEEMEAATAHREDDDMIVDDDSVMFRYWDSGYYCLTTIGKIIQFPASFALLEQWHDELLVTLTKLLLHPHQWIRSASSRVFGILFSRLNVETLAPLSNTDGAGSESSIFTDSLLLKEGSLYNLAIYSALQLQSKHVSLDSCTQVVKNLFFIAKCMHINSICDTVVKKDNDGEAEEDTIAQSCQSTTLARLIKKLAYFCRSATKNCEHTRTRLLLVWILLSNSISQFCNGLPRSLA